MKRHDAAVGGLSSSSVCRAVAIYVTMIVGSILTTGQSAYAQSNNTSLSILARQDDDGPVEYTVFGFHLLFASGAVRDAETLSITTPGGQVFASLAGAGSPVHSVLFDSGFRNLTFDLLVEKLTGQWRLNLNAGLPGEIISTFTLGDFDPQDVPSPESLTILTPARGEAITGSVVEFTWDAGGLNEDPRNRFSEAINGGYGMSTGFSGGPPGVPFPNRISGPEADRLDGIEDTSLLVEYEYDGPLATFDARLGISYRFDVAGAMLDAPLTVVSGQQIPWRDLLIAWDASKRTTFQLTIPEPGTAALILPSALLLMRNRSVRCSRLRASAD